MQKKQLNFFYNSIICQIYISEDIRESFRLYHYDKLELIKAI